MPRQYMEQDGEKFTLKLDVDDREVADAANKWTLKHPRATLDMLGYIPTFFNINDPRPAKEQVHEAYGHGGGWRPFSGYKLRPTGIQYADDPVRVLIAEMQFRDELIRVYDGAWVMIMQKDGSFEISRID